MIVIKVNYTTDAPIIKVNYDDAPIYISTTVDATYISVDYGSGAATNAVWGDITGTLSDQTDLQNALDDKVPYTGATGNVDLGEYELKAGQLTLDTSPTGTASVGTTRWNDTIGSSETTLKGGSVILKNGVDLVARVVNKVTPNTTLTKAAYQAVRISGAQGQRLAVAFAQANNDNNSADTIGLVTETIATNQEGFIMTVGNLEDINTTGSLQGETWADGDVLYLSPTVAGAITNIKPVAPQHLVVIGYVEYAHANHGKIYVKITNGFELGELHDVDTTGATNGQVLKYNGTIWTPSSDLDTGITSLNGLTALTQTFATGTSGTDFNISSATSTHTFNLPTASATNRGLVSSSDWSTFNAKIGGTLATGQVAFGSAANTIAGSNNLFWDNTNGRLGIGTNAPTKVLHVVGGDNILFQRIGSIELDLFNSSNNVYLRMSALASSVAIGTIQNYPLNLWVSGTTRAQLTATNGNLILQNGGTFTDSGQRLQVQGNALINASADTLPLSITGYSVTGSGTTSAISVTGTWNTTGLPTAFLINITNTASSAASNLMDLQLGGTSIFRFRRDGIFYTNSIVANSSSVLQVIAKTGAINSISFITDGTNTHTSGTRNYSRYNDNFSPTSGTGVSNIITLENTINQTGGANGITRGLYVNPTLTTAADWRSIEWSNNTGWGLYGSGTSANYLNGNLGIGTFNGLTNTNLRVTKNLTGLSVANGIVHSGQVQSDVTTVGTYYTSVASTQAAAFSTEIKHYSAQQGTFGAGSTVSVQYGFAAESTLIGATTNYGFFGNIASGTNRWNLYMQGTANNYMAGSLGVGSTSLTARKIGIGGNTSAGSFSYGIHSLPVIQSDVTNYLGFNSEPSTQATTFTLNNLRHFSAIQGTFGASSVVTNQMGYWAHSTLIGATNNFGFYGDIASGTGRWNFFAAGTAANYLNGNTIIGGSAVDGGQKLQVNGTSIFGDNLTISKNQNALTRLLISNTTSGTGVDADIAFTTNAGTGSVGKYSSSSGAFGIIAASDTFVYNDTAGDIAIFNSFSSGKIKLSGGNLSTGGMTINADNTISYGNSATYSRNINGSFKIVINNSNTGGAADQKIEFGTGSTITSIGRVSSGYTTYKTLSASDGFIYQQGAGDISILNDFASGRIKFAAGSSSTAQITIKANGALRYTPMATPSTAEAGDVYYDSTSNKLRCYNGTTWNDLF